MKKFLILLLVIVCCFSLTGCTGCSFNEDNVKNYFNDYFDWFEDKFEDKEKEEENTSSKLNYYEI